MDLNLVILNGKLATAPEIREFESGSRMARLLITVRSQSPRRRVDVIPVILWDPPADFAAWEPDPETRVWIAASVHRRFWNSDDGRRSRLEIVAHHVQTVDGEDTGAVATGRADDGAEAASH